MSLLTDLQSTALEPEYLSTGSRRRTSPVLLGSTLALLAALVVVTAVSATRSSDEVDSERQDLLLRIGETQDRVEALEIETADLDVEIRALGDSQVNDPELTAELANLELIVGTVPVTGAGIVVEVSDSVALAGSEGVVFGSDLSRLVNGLRQAGAEAVAINGRRVTSLTPIQTAGSAITVDYVSLSPPYRVEAIGDPATLSSRFARTSASAWWKYISDNYGIGFEIRESQQDLTLAADPGMIMRFAEENDG